MTKKTDSLIFRYGIKTLWKNTNFLFRTSVSNSFFFKFIKFELKKRNFELLYIEQKKQNTIYIFIFCFIWSDPSKPISKKNSLVFIFKIVLFYKHWFLFRLLYSFFNFLKFSQLNVIKALLLFYLPQIGCAINYKQDYLYHTNTNTNLQPLLFKVEQLKLETGLSRVFDRNFYLKLYNVFNLPLYFDFIQLSSSSSISNTNPNLGTLEFMFYLSCKLRNISIVTQFLAKNLELENRHRRVIWSFINIAKKLRGGLFLFKSIRIYVTGKLNGKMRRKTYGFKLGSLALQEINTNVSYFKSTSFTKFGTISVKIWMFF